MVHPVETNLLFVIMRIAVANALQAAGHSFGATPIGDGLEVQSRICCNWRTSEEDVDTFLQAAIASGHGRASL